MWSRDADVTHRLAGCHAMAASKKFSGPLTTVLAVSSLDIDIVEIEKRCCSRAGSSTLQS
jgi:hypothetical protein